MAKSVSDEYVFTTSETWHRADCEYVELSLVVERTDDLPPYGRRCGACL